MGQSKINVQIGLLQNGPNSESVLMNGIYRTLYRLSMAVNLICS